MLTEDETRMYDLHPAEHPLLGFLWKQVLSHSRTELLEVLSGAHVVLDDPEGKVYAFLGNLPGAERRSASTHRSDRAQYDIPEGRVVSSLLIGYLDNATWFQLEGAPWDLRHHFWSSLPHILDCFEYILSMMTRNVGPLGTSRYTDSKPLRKKIVAPVGKVCPTICQTRAARYLQSHAAKQENLSPVPGTVARRLSWSSGLAAPALVMSSVLADDEQSFSPPISPSRESVSTQPTFLHT
jgi:hypothetical protein